MLTHPDKPKFKPTLPFKDIAINAECVLGIALLYAPNITTKKFNQICKCLERKFPGIYVYSDQEDLIDAVNKYHVIFSLERYSVSRTMDLTEEFVSRYFTYEIPFEIRQEVITIIKHMV
jgi:hypothetical protein